MLHAYENSDKLDTPVQTLENLTCLHYSLNFIQHTCSHFPYESSVSVRISMSSTMEQSTSEVSRTKIFKKFWKMCIGQVSDLSDPMLLVLDLFLWGNALKLVCCPPLCSVGSWLHPIHLEILLNVKHITRQFNPSKELFMFDLGSFG